MHYDFTALSDAEIPKAVDPVFQKTNPLRTILAHQLLSERRFFAQFVDTQEPPVEELFPPGEKYVWLMKQRLPRLAQGIAAWWPESRPFFGGLRRERIWVF